MKIDIFLTNVIDNIIMTFAGTLVRHYFPSRAEIFIKHDTIYRFDDYTPEFKSETGFDADMERRCAQIINHELSHAAKQPWFQIISSRRFQIWMIIGFVLFNVNAVITAIIFFGEWTLIFMLCAVLCGYLEYKSLDFYIQYEHDAKQAEETTDINNGYKGINKDLFDKVKAMK